MTPTHAETVALKAVAFLADRQETLKHFLNSSGLEISVFRHRLDEHGILAAILDFLMRDQALLFQFCDNENLSAQDVHAAWTALAVFGSGGTGKCA